MEERRFGSENMRGDSGDLDENMRADFEGRFRFPSSIGSCMIIKEDYETRGRFRGFGWENMRGDFKRKF